MYATELKRNKRKGVDVPLIKERDPTFSITFSNVRTKIAREAYNTRIRVNNRFVDSDL